MTEPDAPHPRDPYPPPFFGDLAPEEYTIFWSGQTSKVTLKLLSWSDQINVARYARKLAENNLSARDYFFCMGLGCVARALVKVGDEPVDKYFPSIDDRLQWVATFPETLVDALVTAYDQMRAAPLALLDEHLADPDFAQAPSEGGSTSEGADPPSSTPTPGPSSRPISTMMSTTDATPTGPAANPAAPRRRSRPRTPPPSS